MRVYHNEYHWGTIRFETEYFIYVEFDATPWLDTKIPKNEIKRGE